MELFEILDGCPKDEIIGNNYVIAYNKINNPVYKKIICSISGGSDSDIAMDICTKCDKDKKIDYVWFDTGLEYRATKEHLKYLEDKYGVEIKPYKAIKPIPLSCKQYGQPFISKNASEMIDRLQKHNFQWEDKPFDELIQKYCKWSQKQNKWIGCYGALAWWCNANKSIRFCINYNKWLKEFMIANPPTDIKISSKCCKYAKKDVIHKVLAEQGYGLNISGIRKSEGGIRSTSYKNCFDENTGECDNYRPIFWYLNDTKRTYEQHYDVLHSDCYSEYGLKRTGCAGCPFGRDFEFELNVIQQYEPNLYKAVNSIFGKSYEYTRQYKIFYKEKEA